MHETNKNLNLVTQKVGHYLVTPLPPVPFSLNITVVEKKQPLFNVLMPIESQPTNRLHHLLYYCGNIWVILKVLLYIIVSVPDWVPCSTSSSAGNVRMMMHDD